MNKNALGFNDAQIRNVIMNFLKTRGRQGATQEEIEKVVNQVSEDYMIGIVSSLVENLSISVDLVDNELVYGIISDSKR